MPTQLNETRKKVQERKKTLFESNMLMADKCKRLYFKRDKHWLSSAIKIELCINTRGKKINKNVENLQRLQFFFARLKVFQWNKIIFFNREFNYKINKSSFDLSEISANVCLNRLLIVFCSQIECIFINHNKNCHRK